MQRAEPASAGLPALRLTGRDLVSPDDSEARTPEPAQRYLGGPAPGLLDPTVARARIDINNRNSSLFPQQQKALAVHRAFLAVKRALCRFHTKRKRKKRACYAVKWQLRQAGRWHRHAALRGRRSEFMLARRSVGQYRWACQCHLIGCRRLPAQRLAASWPIRCCVKRTVGPSIEQKSQ